MDARRFIFGALACALAAACAAPPRPRAAPDGEGELERRVYVCGAEGGEVRLRSPDDTCLVPAQEIRSWGLLPGVDPIPPRHCPMRVSAAGSHVMAAPLENVDSFDRLPWDECVPRDFLGGSRRVLRVDDGFLVVYESDLASLVEWVSDDGLDHRDISHARLVGFAHPRSGTTLALGIGRARLGRGAVMRFVHAGRGMWSLELVAVLPVEPSGVTFDDNGTLVGYAQRFLFRVGEDGRVENVHYLSREVGVPTSIARTNDGTYFLGLECGVLKLTPHKDASGYDEAWWSAKTGGSGRWTWCPY